MEDLLESGLDETKESRYSAPEILSPEDYDMDKVLITKQSDVYAIGMVAYEASSHCPASPGPRANFTLIS